MWASLEANSPLEEEVKGNERVVVADFSAKLALFRGGWKSSWYAENVQNKKGKVSSDTERFHIYHKRKNVRG